MIKDHPDILAAFRSEMNGELKERGANQHTSKGGVDGVKSTPEGGNSNAYWQARIERDCPEEMEVSPMWYVFHIGDFPRCIMPKSKIAAGNRFQIVPAAEVPHLTPR